MHESGHKLSSFSDHDQWISVKGDGNLQYSRQRGSINTSLQLADVFGTVPARKRDVLLRKLPLFSEFQENLSKRRSHNGVFLVPSCGPLLGFCRHERLDLEVLQTIVPGTILSVAPRQSCLCCLKREAFRNA